MLADRIDADMKTAARAKDARRLGTLRMLKSWVEANPNAPVICGHDPWNLADLERDY